MSNWQKGGIGSGNGLAPNRRQTITWTYADPVHWRIYAALGVTELKLHNPIVIGLGLWSSLPGCCWGAVKLPPLATWSGQGAKWPTKPAFKCTPTHQQRPHRARKKCVEAQALWSLYTFHSLEAATTQNHMTGFLRDAITHPCLTWTRFTRIKPWW